MTQSTESPDSDTGRPDDHIRQHNGPAHSEPEIKLASAKESEVKHEANAGPAVGAGDEDATGLESPPQTLQVEDGSSAFSRTTKVDTSSGQSSATTPDEKVAYATAVPLPTRKDRHQSTATFHATSHRLHRFKLYETNARFFIVGSDITDVHFKILKIDRTTAPEQLSMFEDDSVYTKTEVSQLLTAIDDGNKATGGLRLKCNFWGLLGFIRFTESYYMMLVTKRQQAAMLGGHYTYQIEATELIAVSNGSGTRFTQTRNAEETRYVGILNNLDLSKNFYFSYTYNITRTLQDNIIRERMAVLEGERAPLRDYNDMFVWNHHLLNPLANAVTNMYDWCLPIVHGFIDQSSINVFGRLIYVTIIGRRSRFFAGARFLKRGVNDLGYVANDVETEQIISDMLTTSFHAPGPKLFANPTYTSYVHHRGSIPLYWTQDNSGVTPKPAIDLNFTDPFYQPAALHFNDLFERYGCPVYVLNLIKARERTPRESKLLQEFRNAVDYLNQFLPGGKKIVYKAFDMSRASKTRGGDVIGTLEKLAAEILDMTSFFHNGEEEDGSRRVQNGIARTNCIDCLDRTNAAQFVIGKHAFGLQLKALGIIPSAHMAYDSDAIDKFTHMFHDHGDTIAVQYGGSHLVNTMATYRKINHWQGHGRDMVESFKRYYHNSFLDSQRQEAHNLFLGNYIYAHGQPMLWDLATDHYLHHSDPRGFLDRNKNRNSYIDWYNPEYLEPRFLPSLATTSAALTTRFGVVDYDDFWLEYYRPLILSSFLKVYAYRLSAESALPADRPTRDPASSTYDPSPFVPRIIDAARPQPDSPGKKNRKEVTILDPTSEPELNRGAGPHSPLHTRDTSVGAGILVHPPTPLPNGGPQGDVSSGAVPNATPYSHNSEKEEKSLWTLNKIYESSLNPSISAAETAEYDRYIAHPSNIRLVVSEDRIEDSHSRVAQGYADYLASGQVPDLGSSAIGGPFPWHVPDLGAQQRRSREFSLGSKPWTSHQGITDADMLEFEEFVSLAARQDALNVGDEDRDKKRYKAYRQWLVKGKSLFKQSKVDPEYRL